MNRSHNADQSERSIKMAQQVGFDNITIDLIYGLPNQTLADWKQNLKKMFTYDIQHFSAYALTIENKTNLKHLVNTNKIKPLSEETVLKQFNTLIDMATENGFVHYEISNFGKKGYFRISYCVEDSVLEGSIEGFTKVFQRDFAVRGCSEPISSPARFARRGKA